MKTSLSLIVFTFFTLFSIKGYAGGACTPTGNPACASAVSLTVGGACVNGTTCSGGSASGSSTCIGAGYECSWYSFTASATDMYVGIAETATSGCYNRTEVFSGSCGSLTSLSCMSGAPLDDVHSLSGLTIGNTYYIQVCYSPGGACGNGGSFEFCIEAGEPDPPCDQCSSPCGTAQGYASTPTTTTVTGDCTTSPFVPELQPSSTNTFCYSFQATATSVDFNVIITSNCGGGNVTNFSWDLYNYPTCGAAIQSGTLGSLTFTGLTIGNNYVFCYTFDVPSTCTHTQHCPFFVGATVPPLPITLTSFEAEVIDNSFINLDWITESEVNNDFFTIERTKDGEMFEVIGIVDGAGNSTMVNNYNLEDKTPYKGTSYYRLTQTDFDGTSTHSDLVAVKINAAFEDLAVFPNPVEGIGYLSFNSAVNSSTTINIYDVSGRKILSKEYLVNKGSNTIKLDSEDFTQGMYFLSIGNEVENTTIKFIKE